MLSDTLRNLDYVETGDILLFKSLHSRTASLVRLGTRSVWTHVAIAIWEGGVLKIFESSMSRKLFDELTGTEKFGVRKIALADVLEEYGEVLVRKTDVVRDDDFYTKLGDFQHEYKSRNYTNFLKIPLIPFLCIEDEGIHCSQLVSRYMEYMGLLEDKPNLAARCFFNVLPVDFSPENPDPEFNALFKLMPTITLFSQSGITNDTLLVLIGVALIAGAVSLILIKQG
jgi:hypothetical protein